MAAGDVVSEIQTSTAQTLFNVRPPAGEEWVIQNIYYSQSVSLRMVKGSNVITFDSDTGSGARLGLTFRLTNDQYLQIYNTYNGNNNIGYDGIKTK